MINKQKRSQSLDGTRSLLSSNKHRIHIEYTMPQIFHLPDDIRQEFSIDDNGKAYASQSAHREADLFEIALPIKLIQTVIAHLPRFDLIFSDPTIC